MSQQYFSLDYRQARARFRQLARSAEAQRVSFVLRGKNDAAHEELSTDVAWLGPKPARGVVIVTSGTHGVEGFAGSAFQCWLLAERAAGLALEDVAVVLVHAVNPYGFSQICRVNEDNVDLNRNFVDFTCLPSSAEYDRLHEAIVPDQWLGEQKSRADAVIREAWEAMGERSFQAMVCRGQHTHADGLFYGGRKPSWSNTTWRAILNSLPPSVEYLAHLDVHTGLGPFGYGAIIYSLPTGVPALALAHELYQDLGLSVAGSDESAATFMRGTMNHAVLEVARQWQATSVSIEFGTVEFRRMFEALRADNWLRMRAPQGFSYESSIRHESRSCFCPDEVGWRQAVVARCDEILTWTLRGVKQRLAAGASHAN